MPAMSIDAAVAAVARGDLDAYRQVIVASEPAVRAAVAAIVPARAMVDDGVQEAFVAAHGRLREFPSGGDITTWIAAIARGIATSQRRSWLRAEQSRRGYRAEVEAALDEELAPRAERAAEALAAIGDGLGRLEASARAVVEEHYWSGESFAAIAKKRDRSDAWVRVTLFRALGALAADRSANGSTGDAERLDYLLSAWLAEGLTDAEGRELADLSRRDAAARTRLADLALVHRLLPESAPPPARRTADAVLARLRSTGAAARAETITEEDHPIGLRASRMAVTPRTPRSPWPWVMLLAVAAIAVGGYLLWRSQPPEVPPPAAPGK
jgi:RNA polymerase sigma factor (sigma-70 family)